MYAKHQILRSIINETFLNSVEHTVIQQFQSGVMKAKKEGR